jgi:hypothetical protein
MLGKRAQAGQESTRHNNFGRLANLLSRRDLVVRAGRCTADNAAVHLLAAEYVDKTLPGV